MSAYFKGLGMVETRETPYETTRLHSWKLTETVKLIQDRYHDRELIWLTDGKTMLPAFERIIYPQSNIANIGNRTVDDIIFCLAFDDDTLALKAARDVVAADGIFYSVVQADMIARYWHVNKICREVFTSEFSEQLSEGFSKWDDEDFSNIVQAIDVTRNVQGAFVEIGCFRGSSGRAATRYMAAAEIHRPCYFFDVFEGFNYSEALDSKDAVWAGTHATEGLQVVRERLKKFEKPKNGLTIEVFKSNIITDDLPSEIGQIAIANVDVDIYDGVLAALYKVAPKISRNGIIIVEDPGHTPMLLGARLAYEDFMTSDISKKFIPIQMESGQIFLISK
jgi:macrocin-O-methyltransferase TylF-like protien